MSLDEPVDQTVLQQFHDRVQKQARTIFGTDDEGKISKVQVILIDRSRCEAFHYLAVPYDHRRGTTLDDMERSQEIRMTNLAIAMDAVQTGYRVMRHATRTKKAKG